MKRFLAAGIMILMVSCTATKKTIITAQKTLKGTWSLDNISYDRSGIFDVTLYDDASTECMTGSTWTFVSNNNTGSYQTNQDSCISTGLRNFRFTIPEPDTSGNYSFLFKPIDEKKNSTNNNKGYRMGLQGLDKSTMTWTQTVSLEGKPFVITMKFNKMQ